MDKEIYRGQYPPKNTNLMWVKGKQIYLFDGMTGTWVEVNESTQVDQTFDPTSERAVSAPAILNAAEENLSETSENLIKNKAVYNQYMDEKDINSLLYELNHDYIKNIPLTFVAINDENRFFPILNNTENVDLEYSLNKSEWIKIDFDNWEGIEVNKGDEISLRGDNETFGDIFNWENHTERDLWIVKGNIASILYKEGFEDINVCPNNAFVSLFSNNQDTTKNAKIIDASLLILPFDNVGTRGFYKMFGGNPIKHGPKLPATTIHQSSYARMFINCTELVEAPELPAESTESGSYYGMFEGCTSLTKINKIHTEYVAYEAMETMFRDCSSLVSASDLHIKGVISSWGCNEMFENCTSLVYPPKLESTSIGSYGYRRMFENCTSLVEAPELIAEELKGDYEYLQMFRGCSNLNKVKCCLNNMDMRYTIHTSEWLEGVSLNGEFIKSADALYSSDESGIPENWTIYTDRSYLNNKNTPLTITALGTTDLTIRLIENHDNPGEYINVEYKLNGGDWIDIEDRGYISNISLVNGDKVYLRGNNNKAAFFDEEYGYSRAISFSNNNSVGFKISGNICSLLNKYGFSTIDITDNNSGAFYGVFNSFTNATYAEELILPDVTKEQIFGHMFHNCEYLKTTPLLPADIIEEWAYSNMFSYCTRLVQAPEILATEVKYSGCFGMFSNCTFLLDAPKLNNIITLAESCYRDMFFNCPNLVNAPELPCEDLKNRCYSAMFSGCYSLVVAPELPAKILKYQCYDGMFSGCRALNYIKCLATDISAQDCTRNFTYNVNSEGTFIKDPYMNNWTIGYNGIPEGWEVSDEI